MFRILYYLLFAMASCHVNSQQLETPKEFINSVTVETSLYSQDSISTIQILKTKMQNHEASFYSKEYFDSTRLIVDTIMYDSSLNKMAIFVLTENPSARQLDPKEGFKVYYNAYCYLAKRDSTQIGGLSLKWFNTFYPINFYNKKEISVAVRNLYFLELATIIGGDEKPVYKYNLNDKRFWIGQGWKKHFD